MRPKKSIIILARPSQKFEAKFQLLKDSKEFKNDVKNIRDKWGVDIKNPHLVEGNKEDILNLLKKHMLSKDWEYIISVYITSGEFEPMGDPNGIQLKVSQNKRYADIRIFPDTTLADLKQAYKTIIKELKDGKAIRTRGAKESDRDSFIYNLRNEGKTYQEIKRLVFENYGEHLDDGTLGRIIAKMKKRRNSI